MNEEEITIGESNDGGVSGGSTHDPAIYDHPVVKDLMAQISALIAKQDQVESAIKDFDSTKKVLSSKRQALMDSIRDQVAEINKEIWDIDAAKAEAEKTLREARMLKESLHDSINEQAQLLVAEGRLEESRQRWQDIMDEHDWLWVESVRPYQTKAIEFVASGVERDLGGVAIFDQMGLGKTLEAIAAIDLIQHNKAEYVAMLEARMPGFNVDSPSAGAVLWVCPNSIKTSTARELAKWSDRKVVIVDGPVGLRDALVDMAYGVGMLVICSYEQLRDRKGEPVTKALVKNHWPLVVMDEAHRYKNTASSTFKNIKTVVENSGFIIPMTGTPILNRPDELYAILHMLTIKGKNMGEFAKYSYFANNYLNWNGSANVERLMKSIGDKVIRRTKQEVLKDLPDKLREVRFVELDTEQRELYDMMRDKLYVWLDEQKSDAISVSNFLAQISYLRQIALLPAGVKLKGNNDPDKGEITQDKFLECTQSAKLDECMALVEELLEADEKVLVFANFNHVLHELQKRVAAWAEANERDDDCRLIIGGVDQKTRANFQDRLNNPDDNLRVLGLNIRAGGLGMNLQGACSHAIFMDLDWSPGSNEQAEDRLHRSGQTKDVMIHIIQAEETVDAFIAQKLETKSAMIEGTIERDELRAALDAGLI
jgi:SNF2 family DNA or RNA helicase